MKRALVIGSGMIGLTCAKLLNIRGWEVHILAGSSSAAPTLVLNNITCSLFQDIWQLEDNFWHGFHLLHKRWVHWGDSQGIVSLEQPDAVIKGSGLVDFFRERLIQESRKLIFLENFSDYEEKLKNSDGLASLAQNFSWIIDASGRSALVAQKLGMSNYRTFGNRRIIAQEVELKTKGEDGTYWLETVPDAWVFLAPTGNGRGLLQVMIPNGSLKPSQLLCYTLEQTQTIKHRVSNLIPSPHVFLAFPQILQPLSGRVNLSDSTWITVGDAACCLDPVSGDGTGYGVRGAILATSILDGIACNRIDYRMGLRHYSMRLNQAFIAHVQTCINYYYSAFSSLPWLAEIQLMGEQSPIERFKPDLQDRRACL